MSDEGEKTCPLCAEEMDLTDQQLKPCRCGYDICVWCWHHIMDMAEKDATEGRCPACRTPYNKEKIVGTASKCERLVAEMSVEKKQKSQKGKTKTSEGRKQLSSVRVIQRNLVYIVGLPLNLADEDLLQRKEYFGRYGKVLKVSISRTAAGAIQQFANNTCSVYITYSNEDEAVRSIQSVHGFVLEGRPLRACFGTTKYCHAWLRSMPCTNPDCLYLHEFGSQEDSFTKDEIISEYTRGRVQQVTGATYDMQRRSGNTLPPAADDYSNNSTSAWGKPIIKSTTNDLANSMKVSPPNSSSGRSPPNSSSGRSPPNSSSGRSPPNSSSGRSVALPAAASWGTRALNSQPISASVATSNGPSKPKLDTSTTPSFSSAVVSPSSHDNEIVKKESPTAEKGKFEDSDSPKLAMGTDNSKKVPGLPVTPGLLSTSSIDKIESAVVVPHFSRSSESYMQSSDPASDKGLDVSDKGKIHNLSSDMSLLEISGNCELQSCDGEILVEPLATSKANASLTPSPHLMIDNNALREQQVAISEVEADLLSFNDQRLRDPEVVTTHTSYVHNMPQSHMSNSMGYSHSHSPRQHYTSVNGSLDPPFSNTSNMPLVNGHTPNLDCDSHFEGSNGHSYFSATEGSRKQMGIFDNTVTAASNKGGRNAALDLGENSIISNILSMDFDPWDESLTSPQNLAKLLGDGDKQQGSQRAAVSRKTHNSSQSRFSFAREDDGYMDRGSNFTSSLSDFAPVLNHQNFNHDSLSNTDVYPGQLSNGNGFSSFNFEESNRTASNNSSMFSNKISVSRSQVSAPPGFLGPSRAPPPGFSSNERMEQSYDSLSGNQMFDTSSLLRKMNQAPPPVYNGSVSDLEFMDPAILAVGGRVPNGLGSPGIDMRSNFPSQHTSFENDNRLRLLMQRSFTQQNQRYTDLGDHLAFPQRTDSYGLPSRIVEQTLPNNRSPYQQMGNFQQPRMSSNHWDGWNEVHNGNDIAMAELLRNERLGFNKYYSGSDLLAWLVILRMIVSLCNVGLCTLKEMVCVTLDSSSLEDDRLVNYLNLLKQGLPETSSLTQVCNAGKASYENEDLVPEGVEDMLYTSIN
ncbi:nucleotide-binding alpha-beta plait domain-containing protein [Tanacetum coccineum]